MRFKVAYTRDDEPPGPGPDPARSLALVDVECGDGGAVHAADDAHAAAVARQANKQAVSLRNNLLNKHLRKERRTMKTQRTRPHIWFL